ALIDSPRWCAPIMGGRSSSGPIDSRYAFDHRPQSLDGPAWGLPEAQRPPPHCTAECMTHESAGNAWTHGMADLEPGVRLHYVTAGTGERAVVLLHGFPQTWWACRRVIPTLVHAGYRVVATDARGAGNSWKPTVGFDKRPWARDIHQLVRDRLDIRTPAVLIGHDIGLMVAYAYAQVYRDAVSHLVVVDAPLPGTK